MERLGRDFFRQLPRCAGVYLMQDRDGTILYVGKAKNLRQRLAAYRIANPDRLPRRSIRLLHQVRRVEWRECADEAAALALEAELLRALKPRFNRVGTWAAPKHYISWAVTEAGLRLELHRETEAPRHALVLAGGGHAWRLLVRVFWCALNPGSGVSGMPAGWFDGALARSACIACSADEQRLHHAASQLQALLSGSAPAVVDWAREQTAAALHPFDQMAIAADMARLEELFARGSVERRPTRPSLCDSVS